VVTGKQSIPAEGPQFLKYGQSVTDACIDWETTVKVLNSLRQGVQARRKLLPSTSGVNDLQAQMEALTPSTEQKDFNDLSFLKAKPNGSSHQNIFG
jgi:3-deoxy-7-phosphoheptulonate synthase